MPDKSPSPAKLRRAFGSAFELWEIVIAELTEDFGPLLQEWRPSKSSFGSMCLFKAGKRTLVYLTPEECAIRVAAVLGERAAAIAMKSEMPDTIKQILRDAPRYAEGRGIRFQIATAAEASMVRKLVAIKTAPK